MAVDSTGAGLGLPSHLSVGRNKSRGNTSYMDTSVDLSKRIIRKNRHKSKGTSGVMQSLDQTERNALLEDNTLPYLFSEDGGNRHHSVDSETISNASLIFETQHTRWYHRCFKCNIAINIAMLFAFIVIILLAPWYTIVYSPEDDPTKTLEAVFSLLLISFATTDAVSGHRYYYKIFSVMFF